MRERSAAGQADLACVVISYRDQPETPAAVRSLLDQSQPVEVVVVNSGGGDPAARLREAGIAVPVIDNRQRLYPGGARNLGIATTSAPYVGFLAADCVAEPGWAAARLARHRLGADAVAGTLSNDRPASRSACAQYLLLHHRRMPSALEAERLLFGLSYDRRMFARFGRFREDLRQSEDTEFNSRLSDTCTVVWEAAAVAAHRYPPRPGELLRDQFRRGRQHAVAERLGREGWKPRRGFRVTVIRLRDAVAHVRRMDGDEPRRTLRRAAPLLIPAVIAHGIGMLVGRLGPVPAGDRISAGGIPGVAAPAAAPDPSRR